MSQLEQIPRYISKLAGVKRDMMALLKKRESLLRRVERLRVRRARELEAAAAAREKAAEREASLTARVSEALLQESVAAGHKPT